MGYIPPEKIFHLNGGGKMRVFYVVTTPRAASYRLGQMVIPQMEAGTHGVEVVGFFFFDDNTLILQKGNPIGERLARLAKEKGFLMMMCDGCALERGLAVGTLKWVTPDGQGLTEPNEVRPADHVLEGVKVGCFPDLYQEIAGKVDAVVVL
jgi:sulfur relay (sulfurtransferase) complex TusBCD TusD component (DsrE family)